MKEIKAWKIWVHFFGYFFCFVIGGTIALIPRMVQGFENESGIIVLISEIIRIPTTIILLFLYTKFIVKLPLNKPTLSTKNQNISLWILFGLLLPILTVLLFYVTGNLRIVNINTELSQVYIVDILLKSLGLSLASGFVEEIVFRGYLFNLIKSKYNFWIAAFVPSLFFALIHIGGADSLLNTFQLLVAGLLFSFMVLLIYVYTKNIWNAGIIHFIWNLLLLNGLVSFNPEGKSDALITLNLGDNPFFNGGAFGIESSVPAILVYCMAIYLLWKLYSINSKNNKV